MDEIGFTTFLKQNKKIRKENTKGVPMMNLEEIIHQLTVNSQAVCSLAEVISNEQAVWQPDPETWCMKQVMEHLYNEERIDFRKHLKEMFSDPPQAWNSIPSEYLSVAECHQALDGFLKERKTSIAWLQSLESPNWETKISAAFGPDETIIFSAGDILYSWVAHDFLHIRQINELLFAWNKKQALPCSVRYAGEW